MESTKTKNIFIRVVCYNDCMNVSLRQLEYVVEAARTGSVAGAAQSLSISTSSILMAIEKFEEEFGIQVFVRQRSKGLTVTAAGKRAIARTVNLLDEAVSFASDLGVQGPMTAGDVQIGCYSSISPNIVPQVIGQMRTSHPNLTVHLHEGDIIGIQEFLRSGAVDILLTYDVGLSDEFDTQFLAEAPPHVVLSPHDPLAQHNKISLQQIADHTLLLLNLPQSSRYVMSLFEQFGLMPKRIQKMETFEMTRCAAAAGLGLAILNIRPLTGTTYGGLEVICKPIAEKTRNPSIVLATRKGGSLSRRADIFAQCCHSFFQSNIAGKLFVD